jgi:hypothetical protein
MSSLLSMESFIPVKKKHISKTGEKCQVSFQLKEASSLWKSIQNREGM